MLYHKEKLLLIAGPCMLESSSMCHEVASVLCELREQYTELDVVFKGSYDKANRTSLDSPRGPGLEKGLEMLADVKKEYALPVLTDVHTPDQAASAAEVCDVLQIPAFLCRQTDLLVAASQTGRVVNVKKGQFLSPFEMQHVVKKLEDSGAVEIWQTDRGTTFGYQNLVLDMRNFMIMNGYGHPTICDATHSVQLPGASDGQSGGKREYVPALAYAALAAGANGLFLEVHPDPSSALSDAASQLPLKDFKSIMDRCLRIWHATRI